jgi:DNA-directed RNA polymerase specialized sigma24 family protein
VARPGRPTIPQKNSRSVRQREILPDHQLDVMVLKYLRGMDDTAVADLLGVPIASVRSTDRHARRSLTSTLSPHDRPGGTP